MWCRMQVTFSEPVHHNQLFASKREVARFSIVYHSSVGISSSVWLPSSCPHGERKKEKQRPVGINNGPEVCCHPHLCSAESFIQPPRHFDSFTHSSCTAVNPKRGARETTIVGSECSRMYLNMITPTNIVS